MLRRARLLLAIAPALLAACSGGGTATALTGALSGFVYLSDGALVVRATANPLPTETPLEGAVVTASGGGLDLTDATGAFLIEGLLPGPQTVTVTFTGAAPVTVNATVTAGATTGIGDTTGGRNWTVMVYLNADNDREAAAIADLLEMEQIGSTAAVTVDVLCDRGPGYDTSNGDWTTARRFTIRKSTDATRLLSSRTAAEGGSAVDLGELDLGSPTTLRQFIASSQASYPADHYLLVIWGPGSGWRSRAVSTDETAQTSLATTALPTALSASPKLDLVAFDADLLQMVEVAYEIRQRCALVVGSQSAMPAGGYPYAALLADLTAHPTWSVNQVGALLVNATVDHYAGTATVTQSAIRTAQLAALEDAFSAYTTRLRALGSAHHDALVEARDAAQGYGAGEAYAGYRDLVDLAERLATATGDAALLTAANQLRDAVANAVLAERHDGHTVAASHGLSIYLPDRADYLGPGVGGAAPTQDAYEDLEWGDDTRWSDWIEEYCQRQPRP